MLLHLFCPKAGTPVWAEQMTRSGATFNSKLYSKKVYTTGQQSITAYGSNPVTSAICTDDTDSAYVGGMSAQVQIKLKPK